MITNMRPNSTKRSKRSDQRFRSKGKDSRISEEKKSGYKECANDPSWYIREGQLAKDVASLSFNTAIGLPISIDPDYSSSNHGLQSVKFTAPGMLAIHTIACPGVSLSPVSPINIAAKNLYSFVRHANSGHSNYDSPDLMLYFMAMDNVFNLMYHCQRALGVAQLFSQKNRYIGDSLIESMGFLANNFRENIAQYRARLNMLIVKASVFAIPATFTLFRRHAWMYSNIFADSPVDKAQLYFYVPSIVHQYNEGDGAGRLDPVEIFLRKDTSNEYWTTQRMTFSFVLEKLDAMLSVLQASEDINIMSGDILKAYGSENLFRFALIPENYVVAPMYSEEILDQIHNTKFCGRYPRSGELTPQGVTLFSLESLRVYQDPSIGAGNLLFQPAFSSCQNLSYESILDMSENEPTPERVIVATRNMVAGSTVKVGNSGWLTKITTCGSDICLFATLYRMGDSGILSYSDIYYSGVAGSNTSAVPYLRMFNKAPILYTGTVDAANGTYTLNTPNGDIENYTIVSEADLEKMHQSAILSMLGVPV